MKIIFLDMDGVLCTTRAHIAQRKVRSEWHMTSLDREAVGLLNAIHEHDADNTRYVLSSTWRTLYDREYMEKHLQSFEWTGVFHEDWKTPHIPGARYGEISDWLSRNTWESYIIIDDAQDAGQVGDDRDDNFVQTDHDQGISLDNYNDAMTLLHSKRAEVYLV